LQHEEWTALMAENLTSPRLADEVIVVKNATVGVETSTGKQGENKMFVTQTYQ
jgi:hypothetical protein